MGENEIGDNTEARERARRMAEEARLKGDPAAIPWGDGVVDPNLIEWVEENPQRGDGRKALVAGCGLGDDAEFLSGLGFDVTAFDVAPAAIEWCRKRFPSSAVRYAVADAFNPPKEWRGQFDFVLESYTLQALPPEFRADAARSIAGLVARGGVLLAICRACEPQEERPMIPWPLTLDELLAFEESGLQQEEFEDYMDESGETPVRRFRVTYRK